MSREPKQQNRALGALRTRSLREDRRWRAVRHVAVCVALGLLPSPLISAAAQPQFTFTTIDVPFPNAVQPTPTGINDKGVIAGYYLDLTYGIVSHGFVLSNGNYSSFDFPGHQCTDFHAINNQGTIAGYGCNDGFLFADGQFSTLRMPGGFITCPNGINNTGDIVGDYPPFLLHNGTFSLITNVYNAMGINDLGQIVGILVDHGVEHGCLLSQGIISMVDCPGAVWTGPSAINNKGTIAGTYDNGTGTVDDPWAGLRGFILDENGFSTILVPGSSHTQVFGMNNYGQIVGTYFDGTYHGFLATPPDVIAPTITISATPTTLWPPDGRMVPIRVTGTIKDDQPAGSGLDSSSVNYAVSDDYGATQSAGALRVQSDGSYAFQILLEASRKGADLNGRNYIITVTAQDRAGNVGSAATRITVPHSSR